MTTEPSFAAIEKRDEALPFISNFQDIFLTVGILILFTGLLVGCASLIAGDEGPRPGAVSICGFGMLFAAALLSEPLVRQRRRTLPGIALIYIAVAGGVVAAGALYSVVSPLGSSVEQDLERAIERFDDVIDRTVEASETTKTALADYRDGFRAALNTIPLISRLWLLFIPGVALAISVLYYMRYRLPFAVAMVTASAISLLFGVLLLLSPLDVLRALPSLQFLFGLTVLAAAISFDMRDPERVTRFSNNGFWLHFAAAPMVLGGALAIVSTGPTYDLADFQGTADAAGLPGTAEALATLFIIALFAVIALLLNRRALLVAGLVSTGTATWVLVNQLGLGGVGGSIAITLIVLGGGVLLLGLGWHAARRRLLGWLPGNGIAARLFPRAEADG